MGPVKAETGNSKSAEGGWFATTHWSVVINARDGGDSVAAAALEDLCATYWYPLYAWLRRRGHSPPDAQDLTQSFFASILQRNALQNVCQEKGKFRSFLLASLKHFVANEYDRSTAIKRGGQCRVISINDEDGEKRFQRERSQDLAPDEAFEQGWALTLFENVLGRLRDEYAARGKLDLYHALQPYLTENEARMPHAVTAQKLGLGEGGVRMATLRLRRRFGELLRAEIAQTVSGPDAIDEEIRALLRAVAG